MVEHRPYKKKRDIQDVVLTMFCDREVFSIVFCKNEMKKGSFLRDALTFTTRVTLRVTKKRGHKA